MTPKLWFFAIVGLLVTLCLTGLIGYDILAMEFGWLTITEETTIVTREHPIVPALVGLFLGTVIGTIFGHLWWPHARED